MTTEETKEVIINLRVQPEVREAFRLAAKLRGATMSGLLHQFIFRTVREEKERDPQLFNNLPKEPTTEQAQESET